MTKRLLFTGILGPILFCSGTLSAQQPLNLDFEKVSAASSSLPWGWEWERSVADLQNNLDSVNVHHGKYSLLMKGAAEAGQVDKQSMVFYMETLSLTGKLIRLEAWVRSESFVGSLIIKLDYYEGSTDTGQIKSDSVRPILNATNGWAKFVLKAKLPAKVNWVRISINHAGAGKVWIDDMSLWVNNSKVKELQVANPFTKPQKHWLDSVTSSLRTVDATPNGETYQAEDLAKFKELAGDATIIALGEATHGTSEFFRMKRRILEFAVREMGVRVFAIEDHQQVAEEVNHYVLGGAGTARKSMEGMFGVWNNQEVYDLIKWVRNHNDQHPNDKVEFIGFDMQGIKQPLDSLHSFLQTTDSTTHNIVSALLDGLQRGWPVIYSTEDSIKRKWAADANAAFEFILNKKNEWLSSARTKADSQRVEWGIQYARLVKQYAKESIDPMALYRDEAMAENIIWSLSMRKPGTKILLWAHDVHISRGEHPQKDFNYHRAISMGSWLAKKYGSQYKAFGISTYTGYYRAFPSYRDYSKWINCPTFPGPVGSLDQALHILAQQRKMPAVLLDLRNARQQEWLSAPLPVRFANHICFEYSYWTRFSLPYQFDGIIFIDQTSAAGKIVKE